MDERVKEGYITQEQAQAIKKNMRERINNLQRSWQPKMAIEITLEFSAGVIKEETATASVAEEPNSDKIENMS